MFIDGSYVSPTEARIPIFDTGFLHADLVYDAVSVWDRAFFKLDSHLARFLRSIAGFRLISPYTAPQIAAILARCVDRSGLRHAIVRMHLTRGTYPEGSRDPRLCENRFIAHALPYLWLWGEEKCRNGVHLHVSSVERISSRAVDARFKNFHWGDLTSAQFEAFEHGCDDAVLCGPDGALAEGPGYNIFVAKDGHVATPATNCLEGIGREAAIELCRMEDIPIETRTVQPHELRGADEAFATSTGGGIIPVTRVNGRTLGNGAPGLLTSRLVDLYWAKRRAGWCATPVSAFLSDRQE